MPIFSRDNPPSRFVLFGIGAASLVAAILTFLVGNTGSAVVLLTLGALTVIVAFMSARLSGATDTSVGKRVSSRDVENIAQSQIAYALGLGVACLGGGSLVAWKMARGEVEENFALWVASVSAIVLGAMCLYGVAAFWILSRRR